MVSYLTYFLLRDSSSRSSLAPTTYENVSEDKQEEKLKGEKERERERKFKDVGHSIVA